MVPGRTSAIAVLGSLTQAERRRAKFGGASGRIVVDADLVVDNGGDWLKPFAIARLDADGALHLQAKGMNKGWLDPRYANAEVQYRGVRYCHLVAPEYLRRLVPGQQAALRPAPKAVRKALQVPRP